MPVFYITQALSMCILQILLYVFYDLKSAWKQILTKHFNAFSYERKLQP